MKGSVLAALLAALSGFSAAPCLAAFAAWNAPEHLDKPYVVLVSIDGYRHDYTDRFKPKHLRRLRKNGSSAAALIPVFPSKTFPNHYGIATGLYPERHGIVGNRFHAPDLKKDFSLADRTSVEDGRFYGGLPLWSAAGKAQMVSAVYFWPGSEAEIAGFRPSRYLRYKAATPDSERVDQALEWLRLPARKRPHLVCLYFSGVDRQGHTYGTASKELKEAVLDVDTQIGRLMDGLKQTGLPVNLIVLSDHGMLDLDPKDSIFVNNITDLTGAKVFPSREVFTIHSDDAKKRDQMYADLSAYAKHYRVYRREDIPQRLHYRSPRAGDILVEADPPYSLAMYATTMPAKSPASHGYDPDLSPEMRGIFYAQGPLFREETRIEAVRNIHVYPLVLRLLGLEIPKDIDGDPGALAPLLAERQ
ncbi:MAG: ectonucleotide pyrophosphatase/phosphodiesterase [Elusimicrobiota bacterium]